MNDLITHIEELRQLAKNVARQDFFDELDELKIKLQQNKLYLVVVGIFKRGKSSVINAVIGKPLVPVAVTPVTAIITIFEYNAERSYAAIHFTDGRIEEKNSKEVDQFVNEDLNPSNDKKVQVVRIFDDTPLLKSISLVDTPGIGSSFEHNTATTLQFIPKIDAALFLLSADMPVSRLDTDFLKELKGSVPKIVFVMNKKDLLSEGELKKLIEHNTKTIAEIMQLPVEKINFIPVSAREYEQSKEGNGINRLIEEIRSISTYEKTELLEQATSKRYRWLYKQLQMQLKLKAESLLMPLNELEQKQEKLHSSISIMQDQKDEFESIIKGKIKLLQEQIDFLVNKESATIKTSIYEKLNLQTELFKKEKLAKVQNEIDQFILRRYKEIKNQLEDLTKQQFRNLLQQYSTRSQSFLNELATHLTSLLGISFDMIADKFDLDVYTSFYLSLDSGLGNISSNNFILNKLIPTSVRNEKLINRLKEHYNNIMIRNSASIAYDLIYKIQESFRKFNYDLNNRLKELLENIQEIISDTIQKKSMTENIIEDEIKDLNERLVKMESIRMNGQDPAT